jgi:hypothetical protein
MTFSVSGSSCHFDEVEVTQGDEGSSCVDLRDDSSLQEPHHGTCTVNGSQLTLDFGNATVAKYRVRLQGDKLDLTPNDKDLAAMSLVRSNSDPKTNPSVLCGGGATPPSVMGDWVAPASKKTFLGAEFMYLVLSTKAGACHFKVMGVTEGDDGISCARLRDDSAEQERSEGACTQNGDDLALDFGNDVIWHYGVSVGGNNLQLTSRSQGIPSDNLMKVSSDPTKDDSVLCSR